MRTEVNQTAQRESAAAADELIRAAQDAAGHGSMKDAWHRCIEAARLGRELGDATIIARAAIAITGPSVLPTAFAVARQALCVEAMALLGDSDPDLKAMVEAHLEVVRSAWSMSPQHPDGRIKAADAQRRFLTLQAEHSRAQAPGRVGDRLAIAGELVDLGVASGEDEILAWGRLWRLDALFQLGLRVEWNEALIDLAAVIKHLNSPSWRWRLEVIRASLALQEDRLDDVPELLATARETAAVAEAEDGPMLDLILRSALAERTGEDLDQVEAEVRRALAGMPFLAQGWRAQLLARMGQTAEAIGIWRSLAPHLDAVPPTAVEWLVAHAGHAVLAVLAQDREVATYLRRALEPFGRHHVAPIAMGPYGGPVALVLGRLCAFLNDDDSADLWFREAVTRADAVVAPWYAAQAEAGLGRLGRTMGPLSRREGQIARLVAEGLTNREIAERLVVSVRTVEQHVRSILRKLDQSNRTGIAAWVAIQT